MPKVTRVTKIAGLTGGGWDDNRVTKMTAWDDEGDKNDLNTSLPHFPDCTLFAPQNFA